VRLVEQRRTRTFVPTVNPLRGSAGPKARTCLADLLGAGGSGLPKTSPRALLVPVLATMLGALAFAAVPAFASKPETPEISGVFEVRSTNARVFGVLNPNALAPGKAGTYQYVYRPSTNDECKGAGEVKLPEPPGISVGSAHEELIGEFLGGLEPGTEYAICLVATEPGKTEPAVSTPVTFKTGFPPQKPAILPAEVSGTTATFNATLNPTAPGHEGETYQFHYNLAGRECNGGNSVEVPQSEGLPASGAQAQHVALPVNDLKPNTKYTYCVSVLGAGFETEFSTEATFETETIAPAATELVVGQFTSSEATLTAMIAPGGAFTTYRVEYEPGKTTPPRILPASPSPVAIVEHLVGLAAGTEYHGRILMENEKGSSEAPFTFTTAATIAAGGSGSSCANATFLGFDPTLPDCRAYELVSSAGEVGEVYVPGGRHNAEQEINTARPFRAAADGGSVAFLADPGPGGGDGSSAKSRGNEYLARRGSAASPSGWETANITPPVGTGEGQREYEAFSPDLAVGVVSSDRPLEAADPTLQSPAGCNALFARRDGLGAGSFEALFSETLVPSECGFTRRAATPLGLNETLSFDGESTDHSRRYFQTEAALVAPAVASTSIGGDIYESMGGTSLKVVNRLPNGEVEPHATAGGPSGYQENPSDLDGAVSESGERVVWASVEPFEGIGGSTGAVPKALYDRTSNGVSESTVQLDKAQAGAAGPSGHGQYWAASADGSRVYFTDCDRLTSDSSGVSEGGCQEIHGGSELRRTGNDLYEYDFSRPEGERLVDVTPDTDPEDILGADVQGVIGISRNGTYVYFVAGGALSAGPNGKDELPTRRRCIRPAAGVPQTSETEGKLTEGYGCNLFVVHYDGTSWEPPRFVATLAAIDNEEQTSAVNAPRAPAEAAGDWVPNIGSRTAEVVPDGGAIVFSSTQDLTGYDTHVLAFEQPIGGTEVFLYDFASNKLTCTSCDPTGGPPDDSIVQPTASFTYLPVSSSQTFMHRWVNNEATKVFFDSSQPLVPGDANRNQDVYEWKAEGSEGCPEATSRYGGCVFLLSGGESPDFSFLVDADESGENVFIVHRGPLGAAGPRDDKFHLYDVRAGGGYSVSSLGCTGTGCQGVPPAAPLFATPASATFRGVGNFPPAVPAKKITKKTVKCVKGKKLSRGKCVKARSKKKKVKKANHGEGSK
jgi:hypothetical protein